MALDLALLPDGGVPWLESTGEHADIVLSSRIRLARNIAGFGAASLASVALRVWVLIRILTIATSDKACTTAVRESTRRESNMKKIGRAHV